MYTALRWLLYTLLTTMIKVIKMTAKEVMTPNVLTVQADWPLGRLAEFFIEHGISGAPVLTEHGALIGVVSLTDIVRYTSLPEKEPPARRTHTYYLGEMDQYYDAEEMAAFRLEESQATVRDIMMPTVFWVDEEAPVVEVAEKMIRGRIHRLFVVHKERKHEILGIITALDLLKGCYPSLEAVPRHAAA
ncbi:MAG TPA: CBS domain-containing protein [Rhodothermales bacterium]|nr:CBS domain-containing protein [Rhodothermales bacterium]